MEDWKEQQHDEIFDAVCRHLHHQRQTNPNFTIEHLEGLLKSQYVDEGNDWLGRGSPVKIRMAATIAAYEHFLAEWKKETEG
jgi:hypothetical protein